MTVSVKSRAHRILRKLRRFSSDVSSLGPALSAAALQPGEEAIGVYENSGNAPIRTILVTSEGLHLLEPHGMQRIPFKSIVDVRSPSDKNTAEDIKLTLSNGQVISVPVTGSDGRFKDVFEFVRFLDRVTSDRANHTRQ